MKLNNVKKSNGSLHTPSVITAKEVLAEMRKKNSILNSSLKSNEKTPSKSEAELLKSQNKKVSFMSLFMGKTVRYLVMVLGLMMVSLVSYVLILDNNSLDSRTNAQVTDQASISFNQQNVNSWQNVCQYLKTSACDLTFKTTQVYDIQSITLPDFLSLHFDVLNQEGYLKIDQNKIKLDQVDKKFTYSLKLLTKSGNPFWLDREMIIASETFVAEKSTSKFHLNYLNGECVQFIANFSLSEHEFDTYSDCNNYYYSIQAGFKINTSSSTRLDLNNSCNEENAGVRQVDIPVSWNDNSGIISYLKILDTNYDVSIVQNLADYSSSIANLLYKSESSIDKIQNSAVLRLRLKDSEVASNISIPLEIYYPAKSITSYKYNLSININLKGDFDDKFIGQDFKIGDDKETSLDLNYQLQGSCKNYLNKVELWDVNCAKYITTISPETIVRRDEAISTKFLTTNLQNAKYCVKMMSRSSGSSLWQTNVLSNVAINTTKNTAPKIISKPQQMDILGNQQFNYQIQYSDLENDTAVVETVDKPSWLTSNINSILGVPTETGSNLVSLRVVDKQGNASELQSFYVNVGKDTQSLTFDDSSLMAVNDPITVSGNLKIKWSISTYTAITKEEVYIAKQGNSYTKILTYDGGSVNSATIDSKAYSNGTYTFLIKAYLDDGSVVQQISGTYNFDNTPPAPIASSSSNSTATATSTANSTATKTSTSTATATPVSTSTSTATSTYTEIAASLSDSSPSNGDKTEKSKFSVKGKISFPAGRTYLDNSFEVKLNDKVTNACTISNSEYSCDTSKLDLITGSNTLKIKYSDDRSNTYTDLITFEILPDTSASTTTDSSSSASSSAGLAKVDDEKFFALFGRKIPYFLAYGIGIILLMLILVFTVPWILFYFQDRKANAKAKRLATI